MSLSRTGDPQRSSLSLPTTAAESTKHAQHPESSSACPSGSRSASSRSQPVPATLSSTDMLAYSSSTSSSSVSDPSTDSQSQAGALSEDQDDGLRPTDRAAPTPSSVSGAPPSPHDLPTSLSCPESPDQGRSLLPNLSDEDAISRASLPAVVVPVYPSDSASSVGRLAAPISSDRTSTSNLRPSSQHSASAAFGPSGSSQGPAGLTMSIPQYAHPQDAPSARSNRPRLSHLETNRSTLATGSPNNNSNNNMAQDLRSPVSSADHVDQSGRSARPAPAPAPITVPSSSYDRTEAYSPESSPTNAFGPSSAPARVPLLNGTPAMWEPDDATDECHLCSRQFTLFTRRHHCRSCGRVCCAQCTRRRAILPKHLIVSPSTEEIEEQEQEQEQLLQGVRTTLGIARTRSVSTPQPAYHPPPDDTESEPVRVCDDCVLMGLSLPQLETTLTLVSPPLPPHHAEPSASASAWATTPATAQRIQRPGRSSGLGPGDHQSSDRNVLSQYLPNLNFGSSLPSRTATPQVSRSLPAQPVRSTRRPPSSRPAAMVECPVCTRLVAPAGQSEVLEAHIRACVESPTSALLAASGIPTIPSHHQSSSGSAPPSSLRRGGAPTLPPTRELHYSRYARDTLQRGNPLLNRECLICMEEFELEEVVARMACLCAYHESCLKGWFTRGVGCPTHRPPSPTPH